MVIPDTAGPEESEPRNARGLKSQRAKQASPGKTTVLDVWDGLKLIKSTQATVWLELALVAGNSGVLSADKATRQAKLCRQEGNLLSSKKPTEYPH